MWFLHLTTTILFTFLFFCCRYYFSSSYCSLGKKITSNNSRKCFKKIFFFSLFKMKDNAFRNKKEFKKYFYFLSFFALYLCFNLWCVFVFVTRACIVHTNWKRMKKFEFKIKKKNKNQIDYQNNNYFSINTKHILPYTHIYIYLFIWIHSSYYSLVLLFL